MKNYKELCKIFDSLDNDIFNEILEYGSLWIYFKDTEAKNECIKTLKPYNLTIQDFENFYTEGWND